MQWGVGVLIGVLISVVLNFPSVGVIAGDKATRVFISLIIALVAVLLVGMFGPVISHKIPNI
ncbi:hypothetical protein [Lactobacillus johnsonii]|uniref:Uncharacterized protein n=1 Tax=Lactobacillus johnsonii TaxID=33959 RepID=A0A9X7THT4_LACJH|nr:hypothetical protein [Lactobacillus johnsonii]QIA88455.1 hypothetical protein FEE39_09395 [Lactobacillus johnsonii]QIA88485.1 hypothetical protein FEE39_09555 [Lactobacillus johnsonii]